MTTGEKLYKHAMKDYGLKELPGPESKPRIKQAINLAAAWLEDDDSKTPWCGCIMGLWFTELGLMPPKAYYRAIEWLNVGKPVSIDQSVRGDLVVFARPGGNHIAMVDHWDEKYIYCLGGNQSDQVNVSRYLRSAVKGVRRLD